MSSSHPARDYRRYAWDGALLTVTSALTGLLFYLVHPFMSRLMRAEDYTALVALLALLKVMGVPAAAAQVVMARFVARYAQSHAAEGWVTIVRRATRKITWFGGGGIVLWVALCPLVYRGLGAPSAMSLMVLGLVGFISLYLPIVQGTLQGASRFGWSVASGMGLAATRVVFMVAVAALGGGVSPVLGAVAVSTAAGLLLGYIPFSAILARTASIPDLDTGPMYRFLWPTLIGMGLLQLLTEADLIFCVRLLDGADRDAYTRAAMVARMAIYLPLPVVIAMFPRAVASAERWIIALPLIFSLVCGVAVATGLSLFAPWALSFVFAAEGSEVVALLRAYVWATIPLALCTILSHYLWARGRARHLLILTPVLAGYLGALPSAAGDARGIILRLGIAGCCGAGLLLWAVFTAPRTETVALDDRPG